MSLLYNLARMTTPTSGTGTLTLGSAVSGYLTFSTAGVTDGQIISYAIRDGANSEIGFGTYTASGTTLTRNVINSTNANAAIVLSGTAEVFITPSARDLYEQPMKPGGRLTLVTGVPVMLTTQAAKTTVYYTPFRGAYVPIYDGQTFLPTEFAEMSQATTDTTKSPAAVVGDACYDLFVWNDAGTLRCTRGPAWSYAATITMTIATPCVVTWTAHGLAESMPIVFTNSGGALPTGITAGTTYYVTKLPGANTFNISTSVANSSTGTSGTRVNTSGSQSGTHTGTSRVIARGTGAGTSELQMIKGILTNKNAITNGPAANMGTYVGTIRSNPSAQIDFQFGIVGAPGTAAFLHVWNAYNRVWTGSGSWGDTSTSYTYNGGTARQANNISTNRAWWVQGLQEEGVFVWSAGDVSSPASLAGVPVGRGHCHDTTTDNDSSVNIYGVNTYAAQLAIMNVLAPFDLRIGSHYISLNEYSNGTDSVSYRGDNDTYGQMWLNM